MILMFLFLCSGAFAVSGVVPAFHDVDFEDGLSQDFSFKFILDGGKESLVVEGELAEYVSLDKFRVSDGENVVVSLDLPSVIESPGVNEIWVVAGAVRGLIRVHVPYPEKYIGLDLRVPDRNAGEDVGLDLNVVNMGSVDVEVAPIVSVYFGDEVVEVFEFRKRKIGISGVESFNEVLNTTGYEVGDYRVVASVDYGDGVVEEENLFRLGEQRVEVVSWTEEIRGGIEKFEFVVENFGRRQINDLYAEVSVVGTEAEFMTSVIDLKGWGREVMSGILDTTGVVGISQVKINLYYEEGPTLRIVDVNIPEGFDYVYWIVVFGILVAVSFLVWRVFVFVRKVRGK